METIDILPLGGTRNTRATIRVAHITSISEDGDYTDINLVNGKMYSTHASFESILKLLHERGWQNSGGHI